MLRFEDYTSLGIGETPLYRAERFGVGAKLFVKIESANPGGSIKDRTAYFLLCDLSSRGLLRPETTVVESTSGNLGIALAQILKPLSVRCVCLVDPLVAGEKRQHLVEAGADVRVVDLGDSPDFRAARLQEAARLGCQPGWVWPNQYENPAGVLAHETSTGPEIWRQTGGDIDVLVCSVGTGGTICGTARALKRIHPGLLVIAVEPVGSTIFGGQPSCYLAVGAGLRVPSGVLRRFGDSIDAFAKVADVDAIAACIAFNEMEKPQIGITAGAALLVAQAYAVENPEKCIVAIAPDGAENYGSLIRAGAFRQPDRSSKIEITAVGNWYDSIQR